MGLSFCVIKILQIVDFTIFTIFIYTDAGSLVLLFHCIYVGA